MRKTTAVVSIIYIVLTIINAILKWYALVVPFDITPGIDVFYPRSPVTERHSNLIKGNFNLQIIIIKG